MTLPGAREEAADCELSLRRLERGSGELVGADVNGAGLPGVRRVRGPGPAAMTLTRQTADPAGPARPPERHWEGRPELILQDPAVPLSQQFPQAAGRAVVISGVSFRYPGTRADRLSLDRLSFVIPSGTVFGLLGPNGCGKTTAIKAITGQIIPGEGTVRVFGMDPDRRHRQHRRVNKVIGVVTQDTALLGKLTVRQNLMYQARIYGYRLKDARYLTDRALDLADLRGRADDKAKDLSGGMARRLAIYRAAMHSPRLLVLDEPTVGLDLIQRADLWDHIKMLRTEHGVTVLLTTQYLDEAEALADTVAIMRSGTLAADVSTPQQLREDYGALVITARVTASPEARQAGLEALGKVEEITHLEMSTEGPDCAAGEFTLEVTTSAKGDVDGQVVMLLAQNGVVVRSIDKRLPSLDQVVRELTGAHRVIR